MHWPWMISLAVLAFLIFMVVILLYIKIALKREIEKTKLKMLIRMSLAFTDELYNLEERSQGENVQKAMQVLEDLVKDWNVDLSYNPHKVKGRVRKLLKNY